MVSESFSISINPEWKYIRPIREFIRELLIIKYKNDENAYDASFVLSELLENAVKYSSKDAIFIECRFGDDATEITVVNRIGKADYGRLKRKLRSICAKTEREAFSGEFGDRSFWEDRKGAIGLIMINERCSGKVKIDYEDMSVRMTCTVSGRGAS